MTEFSDIKDVFIEDELKNSYLTYSMSVIVSRALPDVRDGLKPSQRRILIAMNDLNLGPRSKYRKCAKIAGDTSGNYHPHGEQVIYPTLVRMAQPFSTRYLLVDGQGNFGSIDGDPPAAMRYTEARMTSYTVDMMEDLEKETVDLKPNYDENLMEPTVLPAKIPNLLLNGATGIAVGMTTNIPPHNAREVAKGVIEFIDNQECTIDDLMKHIKGPDFPTGGLICGVAGIHDAYKTGSGKITVRARADIENPESDKPKIVITAIPYYGNKTTIIEKIVEQVKIGRITGISSVSDESDRRGMRLVIDLKRGESPDVTLNLLYKHTPLQTTFGIIMVALVDDRPRVLNLKQMISEFVRHRVDVIRRRTRYMLRKAEERAHIVEGLRIALDNIDDVIETIRSSRDSKEAKEQLQTKFKLSERQADAILQMRLQRLVGLERERLEEEYQALMKEIAGYKDILNETRLVYDMIKSDMHDLIEKSADERRSEITAAVGDFNREDLITEEDVCVTITHNAYVKRMSLDNYRSQNRGGMGISGMKTQDKDFVEHLFIASTHDYILYFTNFGQVYWLKVYDIPEMSRTSQGRALVNILEMREGERIEAMIPVRDFSEGNLILATKRGVVKKTVLSAFGRPKKGGIIAIRLDDGDELVGAVKSSGDQEVILAMAQGKAIRFPEVDIREMGRATRGVGGVKLKTDDEVVSMVLNDEGRSLLTITETGMGKRSSFEDYRLQSRNGGGVINMKLSEKTGKVVSALSVVDDDEIMMITHQGMIVRTNLSEVRVMGRATSGVRILSMKKDGDYLVSVAQLRPDEEIDEAPEGQEANAEDNADESAPTIENTGETDTPDSTDDSDNDSQKEE